MKVLKPLDLHQLFMSMEGDDISDLWLLTRLLFILYMKYEHGDTRWNENNSGKLKN
jgi:hypothetical protein